MRGNYYKKSKKNLPVNFPAFIPFLEEAFFIWVATTQALFCPSIMEFTTCFYQIMNQQFFFSQNLQSIFFRELQSVFFCYDIQLLTYIVIFDINRKLLPCRKTKQRKFRVNFRGFRNRENMR